jgi:hypothetical protein
MLVEGRKMNEGAVTGNYCALGVPDVRTKARVSKLDIRHQTFAPSHADFTCVGQKAPELFHAFFATERQCCMYHPYLFFLWEKTDDTVPLCDIPDGTFSVFQPGHHTGLADDLNR